MAVTNAIKESMSAVIDDEGTEMDLARVIKAVNEDAAARTYWQRLQLLQSSLTTGFVDREIDVSTSVRERLIDTPVKPIRRVGSLGSLAVAASVAFAVVFGGQIFLGVTLLFRPHKYRVVL